MKSNNQIINFIHQRFPNDNAWTSGNCFYFATILKARFPEGEIYYDVIPGHFIFKYQGQFYDWTGEIKCPYIPILWENFKAYDEAQYKRIIENCIK